MSSALGDGSRRIAFRDGLGAVLVQILLLLAFFWTPISRYGEVHYSAADLTQSMSLTRIDPDHMPGNQLQSDSVTQMKPWAIFNRAELAAGRLPLWNPRNGAGTPHFANYQSAVFSPFSVPFYVLDFKLALLVSAALKLLVLGLFTYLFLREIGCGWLAATIGGAAFQFAGHNALLLYFPHVGAMCALPAGLFFVERALRRIDDALSTGRSARLFPALAGLTASLVVGLLAGNPEPFYFACWGIGMWIVVRLVGSWRAHGSGRAQRRALLLGGGKIALSLALALGFAAFQVLPFLDYLHSSRVLEQRSLRQTPLEARWWPLYLFPDALGNPSAAYRISDAIPEPNYELVNVSYVGGLVMLLAALCPFVARGRPGRFFFPVFAITWFVYAHDVLGAYDLFALIPSVGIAPTNRSQGLWNFVLVCAAALAIDAVFRRETARGSFTFGWFTAGWFTIASGIAVVAALIGVDRLIRAYQGVPSPFHDRFLQFVPQHLACMTLWTAIGVAAVAAMLVVPVRIVRGALAALVGVAIFVQTGWLLHDYNPVSPDEFVFPRTPNVVALKESLGDERVAILGNDGLPPDSNIVYGISQLASYDGMWERDLDFLYRDHFGDSNNWRPILRGSYRSLLLFGTPYVLAKWDWNFLDSGLKDFQRNLSLKPQRVELLPGRGATQTFRCYEKDLSCVMVVLSTPADVRDCTVRVRIEDPLTNSVLRELSMSSADVQSTVYTQKHSTFPGDWDLNPHGRPVVFRFEPIANSRNLDFRLRLDCEDGLGGNTICAWNMPVLGYGLGSSAHGNRQLPGELLFDWTCGQDARYRRVRAIGDFTLFELNSHAPIYSLVDASVSANSDEEGFELVRSYSFDPRKMVVLGVGDEATRARVAAVTAEARARRLVQFASSPYCYLVSKDGRRLAHIDDEATFLAHRFTWDQIERLPDARRADFEFVPDDDFEGRLAVGLRAGPAANPNTPPEILEVNPTRIRLRVERRTTGYLVAANAYDPGWKAKLSGEDVPVLRANYAFQAVEIPPGTWEVELRYWPDSLTLGLWIGAASLLVAIAAGLASRRAAHRESPA